MTRGPLLIWSLALLLGACNADAAKSSQDPGGAGSGGDPEGGQGGQSAGSGGSGSGGRGGTSGTVDGGVSPSADAGASADAPPVGTSCASLVPVSAPSFENLVAAAGATLRVRVQSNLSDQGQWTWTARFGDGAGTDLVVTKLDPQGTLVTVPIERAGRYQLTARASLAGTACTATAIAFATSAESHLGQFRLRITPPAGNFPVQEVTVQATAGMALVRTLSLQRGEQVSLQPRDELGRDGIASYVRVSQNGSSLAFEGHTGLAQFRPHLLATSRYDVLFVPDEEIAPLWVPSQTPAALNVLPQTLSPGAALSGRLLDANGAAVKDGRVILRAGPLTSTVGTSGLAGDFALHVRAGQFSMTVAPPPGSGLPELTLTPENGLNIGAVASAGTMEVKWAAVTPVSVGLIVQDAQKQMVAGVRVRLDRVAPLAAAATLTYRPPAGAPVTRSIPGYVRLTAQAGLDGTATVPAVLPGAYRLTIVPADGDGSSALTELDLDVPAGGIASRTVALATRVPLRGKLPTAAAGAQVYATPRDTDPPRPVAVATVSTGGSYQLDVDPRRSYLVWADPARGGAFARAQLATVAAGATGAAVPDRPLPKALPFTGRVTDDTGMPIGFAVIQVFCDQASTSCFDPTLPLGEGITDGQGSFGLTLPDPGSF
jgi:hypothetical protein